MYFFHILLKFLMLMAPVLLSVAFITLLERKVLGLIGLRPGPNKVSFLGILQPLSDAIKLSNKQVNSLSNFSYLFYYLSSIFMILSAFILWSCIFSEPSPLSYKFSVLILFMALGFNSLNSVLAGWSAFSKYSLVGSLRTVSQLISYEAVLYIIFLFMIYTFSGFSFYSWIFHPVYMFFLSAPIFFYIWVPSVLAELNRTPFDFSEGESELVSGFNTEFGSGCFTLIFLAEYSNIIFLSCLTSFIFFQGSFLTFFLLSFFFIIWIRSVLPRFRYDKLMMLAWKFYIPFITLFFIFFLAFNV